MMSARTKGVLIVAGALVLPALVQRNPAGVIQFLTFSLFLAVERILPRIKQSFTSAENIRNAVCTLLKWAGVVATYKWFTSVAPGWDAPDWGLARLGIPLWAQAVTILLVIDFKSYVYHRCQHRFKFLWKFHKLHHAVSEVSVLAANRVHFIEFSIAMPLASMAIAYALGASRHIYFLGFLFPAIILGDAIPHTNLDIPKVGRPWLGYLINLPNTHARHHAIGGENKNFGIVFSFWDVIFGTFKYPESSEPRVYGLEDGEFTRLSLWRQLLYPLIPGRE
jgi:sterol desaturase/sphingolipid hydroxylase (fatty acid hydroxylase superfamily)